MDKTKLVKNTYNKIASIYTKKYYSDTEDLPFIDKFLSMLPEKSEILDVGSGPGQYSEYIHKKGFGVKGVDLSKKMVEIARKKVPQVKFTKMDMRKLEYPKNTFDGLIVSYSLIHIPSEEIPATLEGFNKVIKPKGLVFVIAQAGEPDRIVDEILIKGEKIFVNFFTRKKIKDFLKNAGFETVFQKEKQIQDTDSFSNRVIYTIAQKTDS